jgi:hypothetical protein
MQIKTLRENIRKLGYQLAVREIYGENTPEYFTLKRSHQDLLYQLYRAEKRTRHITA